MRFEQCERRPREGVATQKNTTTATVRIPSG
jgi:hypothetical protein